MTVEEGSRIVPAHQPKEYIYSCCFTELALQTGTEMSYRNAVQFLNKLLHRDTSSSIKLRTYSDYCTKHGKAMENCLQTQAAEILEKSGFNGESAVPKAEIAETLKTESDQCQKETDIREAIERINANRPAIQHADPVMNGNRFASSSVVSANQIRSFTTGQLQPPQTNILSPCQSFSELDRLGIGVPCMPFNREKRVYSVKKLLFTVAIHFGA